MFEVFCPSHQSAVLLTSNHIEALHNTPEGIVIAWRCWCGQVGETDNTKRRTLGLPEAC